MIVRRARPEDTAAADRIEAVAFAGNRDVYRPKPTARPVAGDPAVTRIVAAAGDEIIGTASLWFEADACHLGALAVAAEWRGRGVAIALLDHVQALCGDASIDVIVASTIRQAGQVGFYERCGFVIIEEHEPTWAESVTGEPITEVRLHKLVSR